MVFAKSFESAMVTPAAIASGMARGIPADWLHDKAAATMIPAAKPKYFLKILAPKKQRSARHPYAGTIPIILNSCKINGMCNCTPHYNITFTP